MQTYDSTPGVTSIFTIVSVNMSSVLRVWVTTCPTCPLWQVELQLRLRVPQTGHYVVMLEYATEVDQLFVVDVNLKSPGSALAGQVNIYSCKYR